MPVSDRPQHACPPRPASRMWLVPLLLAAATAGGAFLRLAHIGGKSLWIDEAFSVWVARHSLRELLAWVVRIDQHPPLYYLLLHAWLRLGQGAAMVRALSAAAGTLNIPVMYLLGRRLGGPKVGLLAAIILAVSPFHIHLGQEARMYALLNLSVSLAVLALAHLLADGRARTAPIGQSLVIYARQGHAPSLRALQTDLAWLAYVLCTAAATLTHHTALLFPAATNLFVLGWLGLRWIDARRHRPNGAAHVAPPALRNWLAAQAGVLLLWSPWFGAFLHQAQGVYREFWLSPPTWTTVAYAIGNLANAFFAEAVLAAGGLPLLVRGAAIALVGVLYVALVIRGTACVRRRPALLGLLGTLFVVPLGGELLASLFRPVFYERTLIWASIPLYLVLAFGLCSLRRPLRLAAMALLVASNLLGVRYYMLHYPKEEWNRAAEHVARSARAGDLILFNATWTQIPFDYYFDSIAPAQVEERGVPVDLFDRGVLEPEMTTADLPHLHALIRDRQRVWLVYSHNWYTDPQRLIPRTLEQAFVPLKARSFYEIEVVLYGRPTP